MGSPNIGEPQIQTLSASPSPETIWLHLVPLIWLPKKQIREGSKVEQGLRIGLTMKTITRRKFIPIKSEIGPARINGMKYFCMSSLQKSQQRIPS